MLASYSGLALMALIGVFLALVFLAGSMFLGPKDASGSKEEPWECGTVSVGSVRQRFSVRFYIVALLFVVFDIEAVFLFPWAVLYRELGWFGLAEMSVFVAILLVGLGYVWKKGALEWE
ncbi:MAG: NADH-quinone oxidoreductase subunit A [Pseudomonadota bacterium]